MNHFFQSFSAILRGTLFVSVQRVVGFLPNLLSAVLILAAGWAVALLLSAVTMRLCRSLRLDTLAERRGLKGTLADVGIDVPISVLLSQFVFWLTLLLMLEPLTEALRLSYLSAVVERLLGYLPSVLAAALILLVGLSLVRVVAGSVRRTARSAKLEYAGALAVVVRYFLSLIVVIVTLAQLGVQTAILTVIFAVILLSVGIAVAVALGLGSRLVVGNILAGAFIRDHFEEGREIEVQGISGKVISVDSVGTTLDSNGRRVTVPNTVLMENVVE